MSAAEAIRRAYTRVLGKLLAFTGTLADAEDAVHEAVVRALGAWPTNGLPESPEAWLVTVAQNVHRDRSRRARRVESHGDALEVLARLSPWEQMAPSPRNGDMDDELLRLVVVCCHPALEVGESAALALATVIGLSNDEVARAFMVAPRSMEQRLTRARKRLRERGALDASEPLHERLPAVLRTIHLLFNEGYWSTDDDAPIRVELCRLALDLARSLVAIHPQEPEAIGLLALLLLHEARRPARIDGDGAPVPLTEQDRTRWDRVVIDTASALLDRALAAGAPGPMQIEAAIVATHCRASDARDTDWVEIAALYDLLEARRATSAVRVNRAFAHGQAFGPRAGLALLDACDLDVETYPYVHLVRGALLADAGETDPAVASFEQAIGHARNGHERRQIAARITSAKDRDRGRRPPPPRRGAR